MEILGEKLAKIEAEEIEQSAREEAAKREAVEVAERQRRERVHSSFEGWKGDARSAINDGKQPPSLPVAYWMEGTEGFMISNPKHRDNNLYLDLERWAQSEGLAIKLRDNPAFANTSTLHLVSARSGAPRRK
jgi:hypothetical protein